MNYDPHRLAEEGVVSYCGDMNPLDHDGYWYDTSTWKSDGYASCVEVLILPDGPSGGRHLLVSKLVINLPNKPEGLHAAFESCGTPAEFRNDTRAQIEACKGYAGAEPDESDWREPSVHAFILPDDGEEARDFADYAKIHNATLTDEETVWALLEKLVGRELNQNPRPADDDDEEEEDEGHEAEAQADREGYSVHGDSDES